jgi:exosortase/archaeosortase family protein
MMAVAAAYAYITQKTNGRRWTLFLSSIPLAVVGNTVRLLTVGVVAAFLGTELAVGVYHDYSGYIFYAVTLSALLGIDRAMNRRNPSLPPTPPPPSPVDAASPSAYRPPPWCYLMVLGLVGGTLAVLMASGKPHVDPRLPLRSELPVEVEGWKGTDILFCQNPSCLRSLLASELTDTTRCPVCLGKLDHASYAELQVLPADTRIARKQYQHSDGGSFTVTIVFSGQGRSSLHRPEICLPSQGFTIAHHSLEPAPIKGRHPLTVSFLTIEHRLAGAPVDQKGMFCYWFTGGRDRETASHIQRILWMAEDRILRNTSTRWAYVSVLMTPRQLNADSKAEMIQWLGALYPLLKP